ncbi:RluA family pseudouridine synthase [Ornithinibacillus contaminans]|uniref:RluA family pseudouridine synthase n=1 Tax=Ornithinibacillus contaminans TaxID=694055 RepID=UPI00064DB001|nr:RluA family pseudouridine synthase [Ornithinibacillus contaminans]
MEWNIKQEQEGMLLRDFLRNEQGFSRRILKSLIYDGGTILVNGEAVTVRHSLRAEDTVTVKFPLEVKGPHMIPEEIPLEIIYEDDAVLVINKQANVATIPSLHHQTGTIANGVLHYYEQNNIPFTIHIVTRLDRDTSGLLLIAKHRYSHSILSASQKQGNVKRKYFAIVEGTPIPKQGTIDGNIGRKDDSIIERVVRADGQRAITHYQVIRSNQTHALVEVKLETGRTHQIRVHFSHIGHPLAGDDLYGGTSSYIERQALHCFELGFEHPATKEWKSFTVPMPDDMKKILPGD